jgi:hypothetical protein
VKTEPRTRRVEPDLDAEQEIDLGRYGRAVAARWWLPVLGIVAGAAIGYVLALGDTQVWRAQALVYLGQPFTPNGSAQLQSLATNPSAVREIARSTATIRRAAAVSGMTQPELRRGVSTQAVEGNVARLGQTPLVAVSVRGDGPPRRIGLAANEIARIVVGNPSVSGYVNTKIETLEEELDASQAELDSLNERIDAATAAARNPSLTAIDKLVALSSAGVLEQRRAAVLENRLNAKNLLALAEDVERPRIADRAAARRVTAQSRRNSIAVGALIGLVLGLGAALLWDAVAPRFARRPGL